MPLKSVENIAPDVYLGMWNITESVDDFLLRCGNAAVLEIIIAGYTSEQRRREVLAVRMLLDEMIGTNVDLLHDESGCPYLSNSMNIGISHTKGFASVIVSPGRKVAVDVEYMSDRVRKVAARMLRTDESADTLLGLLLHWCVKETLYKLYSDEHLALKDMQVLSVEGDNTRGIVKAKNVKRSETLDVFYRVFDNKVHTYAIL